MDSTYGLPNVFRTKYITLKIIWTIIFLAALGVSIYFLYSTINEYLQYDVTTVVRSINEDEMDFPVVTVCSTNKVTNQEGYDYFISYLNEYNITVESYLNQVINGYAWIDLNNTCARIPLAEPLPFTYYYKIPIKERENLFQKKTITAYYQNEHIESKDFVWLFNPIYGNCIQINTDSNLKIQKFKENKLELAFGLSDYYKITQITQIDYNNLQNNQFYLFVGDKKLNPHSPNK